MRKSHIVLVLGMLAVMMISNLEDYISSPDFSIEKKSEDAVDYYLTDFKVSTITGKGHVSHTMNGDYLAHWQQRETSFIISPRFNSESDMEGTFQTVVLNAEEAVLNHRTNMLELGGAVRLMADSSQDTGLRLETAQLQYYINEQRVTTTEDVNIVAPQFQLSGTGLDSQLDESVLRLEANVKSVYQAQAQVQTQNH